MTVSAVFFCLFALVQTVVGAQSIPTCELPKDLWREIAVKYPGAKLVSLSDLREDDKAFFQKGHGDACPGLVQVDFYGDRKTTPLQVEVKEDNQVIPLELD